MFQKLSVSPESYISVEDSCVPLVGETLLFAVHITLAAGKDLLINADCTKPSFILLS